MTPTIEARELMRELVEAAKQFAEHYERPEPALVNAESREAAAKIRSWVAKYRQFEEGEGK